ncbi:extracellular solute-binding protein [Paenibacillus mesophilus]|uniref:ABC transporter substrate-binding protein n=1 Tax=Paenibacillus mesophilus TaxID=2582849 RepID=UPI00110EA8FE|nr:extracellular solute-binding protein [Paenibacillus mesophilus]TMV45930.1 extracellular solute-binding protein [Paenibacillus mesophilus]
MKSNSKSGSRFAGAALTALLAVPVLLAACSAKTGDAPAKQVLRIPFGSEQTFQSQYGDYFAVKFPDIQVEIIPTEGLRGPGKNYTEEYEKLIREQKPDLLVIYSIDYDKWASKGLLLDLEPFARKSKFDLDSFTPSALAQLKSNTEGKLFGLAPELTSYALYYNKDLFDKYGVPYPTNEMSWEDTMKLARRFPVDPDPAKRIYGIHEKYSTPFDFVNDIASTENAAYLSPDRKKMTLDSDVWKKAFRQVIEGFKSGNLYYYYKDGKRVNYGPEETKQMDLFSSGKAAMMISGTEQMFRMKQWGENGLNWDIVTVPVDPANPEYTRYFNVSPIYSIAANAQNAETAWKVVQYFNSEEAARVNQKTSDVLSTRTAFAKTKDGRSLEPFYTLKRRSLENSSYAVMPSSFYGTFETFVIRVIDDAVKNRLTVDEALRTLQTEGQALLDKAWAEEAAKTK